MEKSAPSAHDSVAVMVCGSEGGGAGVGVVGVEGEDVGFGADDSKVEKLSSS